MWPKGAGIYIRRILSGHGISNIYSPKVAKARGDHTITFIQMHLDFDHGFINVGSGIRKRSRHATRLYRFTSKTRLWVLVVLIFLLPSYVLVHIKYLMTLRTKFTRHLTHETILTYLLNIRLWVSIVLMLPAKYSGS